MLETQQTYKSFENQRIAEIKALLFWNIPPIEIMDFRLYPDNYTVEEINQARNKLNNFNRRF